MNSATWIASLFGDAAQAEVFDVSEPPVMCAVFAPGDRSEQVNGGYRISGAWRYASGSAWADWALLGMVMGDQADGSPHPGLALVPMSELTTKDTWRVAGMCATASNTLLADDLFVPDHRVHSFLDLTVEAYARTDDSEPTARASFAAAGTFIGAAPIMVGVAKAALDITLEQGASKAVAYSCYAQGRDSPTHQLAIGKAVTEIDLAQLLARRCAATIDEHAELDARLTPLARSRCKADTAKIAELARTAIGRLLTVNGASSFASGNHLQRAWRDAEVAGRHALILPELADLQHGRVVLGIEEPVIAY